MVVERGREGGWKTDGESARGKEGEGRRRVGEEDKRRGGRLERGEGGERGKKGEKTKGLLMCVENADCGADTRDGRYVYGGVSGGVGDSE